MKNKNIIYDEDNFIPASKVRDGLFPLLDKMKKGNETIYVTRRGRPEAVLVDLETWNNVKGKASENYTKTYIKPELKKYTRIFTDEEIAEWAKEDQLE